jgi:hypothetical protein
VNIPCDRQLDRQDRAVGAHGLDLDAAAEEWPLAGGEMSCESPPMGVARGRRDDELGHLTTERVATAVAEAPLRGRVPLAHAPGGIDRDDAVERGFEDRAR